MACSIGVLGTRYIWVGIVEGTALGEVRMYPGPGDAVDLKSIPADEIVARIRELIGQVRQGRPVVSVGAGLPGIVRGGVIHESPNLGQLKGMRIEQDLHTALLAD